MAGLVYHKIDLHTHTPASRCYSNKQESPESIVAEALEKELDAIAVTDHNTAEWIDRLKKAAEDTDLVIFPGVEISMSDGFHLIAIFDTDKDRRYVENFLGAIDVTADDYGKQHALCTAGPYKVVQKIHDRGGLAVLAHIDVPRGAFYQLVEMDKKAGQAVKVPNECSTFFNRLPYDAVECATGQLPEKFDEAHGFMKFPAVYQASDNPDPEDATKHSSVGLGTRHSWFKMEALNLEGLRQCFVDPEVRIRLADQYQEVAYPRVVSMRIGDGGFFRNPEISFHKGLNCIIGGKGVGKSLAVEFLRFALDQPSDDPELFGDYLGKLHKRLTVGNTVGVVYQLQDESRYEITRTYDGRQRGEKADYPKCTVTCVNVDTGGEFSGDISRMFPLLAYSQTEVIKISEDKQAQLKLIDRLIDTQAYELRISQLTERLRENDQKLALALDAQGRLEECEQLASTLQEHIDSINRALANPVFNAMKKAESKKRSLEGHCDFVQVLIDDVEEFRGEVKSRRLVSIPKEFRRDKLLKSQRVVIETCKQGVLDSLSALGDDLRVRKAAIKSALDEWLPEFREVEEQHRALLEESGGDQKAQESRRKELEDQKRECMSEADQYRARVEGLPDLMSEREAMLDQLEEVYSEYFETRKAKFDHLTQASGGKLELALEHASDTSRFADQLVEILKGGHNAPNVPMRRQIAERVSPRRFGDLIIRRDKDTLADESGLTELWGGRVIEKLWSHEDFSAVLGLQYSSYPADIPHIRFRKPSGKYEELSELSVGQKCTALLIIALCDGRMPVLIDQPEDALDIVSVWEDVAQKLRRGKDTRQFILTTHNSSIAVAADSDQFIVLEEAGGDHGKVVASGAIDRPEVRKAVVKRLEGGDRPYSLRSLKYNMPRS